MSTAYKVTAQKVVEQAQIGSYIGIPYKKLDCQALVEQILKDCGLVSRTNNKAYNLRGSNHMWRDFVHGRTEKAPGVIPEAACLVFTIKHDGGEVARGYHDDMGNASHVGLYLGGGVVIHSTTGGVQWDKWESKRWTHYAMCNYIVYDDFDFLQASAPDGECIKTDELKIWTVSGDLVTVPIGTLLEIIKIKAERRA